jgi:ribokinase
LSASPAVVVVGSLNTDHVVRVGRLPVEGETVIGDRYLVAAGGKGLNQAVAAARQGASVAFVGCVGDDRPGRQLLDLLVGEGVDVGAVRTVGDATGVALVTVAAGGANTVVVAPLANSALTPSDVEAAGDMIDRARVVLAQLEVPHPAVTAALWRGRSAGAVTILNPAPAGGPLPSGLLELVDVLVPNQTEAAALTGLAVDAAATALRRSGPATVIVTMGAAGALAATEHGVARIAPFDVRPVDPTGAGDAFCGTLAAAVAAGQPLDVALRRASAAGALAATAAGAVPSLPGASAVDALLNA